MGSIPLGGGKAYVGACAGRDSVIADLEVLLSRLALEPDAKIDEATIAAVQHMLDGWENLAKAISSSNRGYEILDLQPDTKRSYERALHYMRILRALAGS